MELLDSKMNQLISIDGSKYIEFIKAKWKEIDSKPDVFRYHVDKIEERIVDNKYLLQLNPNRKTNRRIPEQIFNICQQFDDKKFNFTKVSDEEVMFSFKMENSDDIHKFIVNVSPVSLYHTLLCPSIEKCLPQVVTKESLELIVNLILLTSDKGCDLRIGFNSLCALASVNHLHYHLFFEKSNLPVETMKCKQIRGPLYYFESYPVPAFCFIITKNSRKIDHIYRLIEYLLQKSIAHNIFITRGDDVSGSAEKSGYRFIIWPRKSSFGAKHEAAFNIAVLELSGWFPIYNAHEFHNITAEELENELRQWKIDDFEKLCENVKALY